MEKKLTQKQRLFADFYIETGNATQSAIRAGYSQNAARQIASDTLSKPYVKSYIDERMKAIEDASIADATEILQYLTRVVRNNETEQVVITESTGDCKSEAKIVDKEISAKDKIKAAELIGKRYGTFVEKIDMNASVVVFEGEDDLKDE